MTSHDQEKLLKEILPSDDLANFRQTSLEHGLAGLRREQRRRHVVRSSALSLILIGLFAGIFLKSRNTNQNQIARTQPPPTATSPAQTAHVDFINDEQLLALFTNQPVALVGKPGEQRLVFLGQSESDSEPHQY